MNDLFTQRVRAAAIAGWWTVLIVMGLLMFSWWSYVSIIARRPAWMVGLWGGGITWEEMRTISLWFFSAFKLVVWLIVMIVVW
jgi:hypothetical protein